jgi:hypothetical protein
MQLTVNASEEHLLSQKDLQYRWGIMDETGRVIPVSTRTVQRERKRWGLRPKTVHGSALLFRKSDVEIAEKLRTETLVGIY